MNFEEYAAKPLLKAAGIAVPPSALAFSVDDAVKAAEDAAKEDEEAKKAARKAKRAKKKAAAAAEPKPLTATFRNTSSNVQLQKAELYYETTRWGNIGHGDPPISVGTFTGHRWFVKVGDTVMKELVIGTDDVQEFTF